MYVWTQSPLSVLQSSMSDYFSMLITSVSVCVFGDVRLGILCVIEM